MTQALEEHNAREALAICRTEDTLDRLYFEDRERIKAELRKGKNTDDLVTTLSILHYLERMGDALLNIGEAILYTITGENNDRPVQLS